MLNMTNEDIEYATSLGIDVVITDHHKCKEVIPNAYAVITLRHFLEPSSGYMLGVRRLYADGKEARATIVLSSWEALGICEAITASMSAICFGAPVARARTEKPTEKKHEAA